MKDEAYFDRFDRAFAAYFKGVEAIPDAIVTEIPAEWLQKLAERWLTDEEKAMIEALGGWEKLMETLREAAGGAEGRATRAATSGSAPRAPRPSAPTATTPRASASGRTASRNRSAVKVWDQREYRNLTTTGRELGTRNIKMALRRLRRFAREGAPEELDLDGTIRLDREERRLARPEDGRRSGTTR